MQYCNFYTVIFFIINYITFSVKAIDDLNSYDIAQNVNDLSYNTKEEINQDIINSLESNNFVESVVNTTTFEDVNLLTDVKEFDNAIIVNEFMYEKDKVYSFTHNNITYSFEYEGNNVIRVSIGEKTFVENSYDGNIITSRKYGNGDVISSFYDKNIGRLITQKINDVDSYQWTYNDNGSISSFMDLTLKDKIEYIYNEAGILSEQVSTSGFAISFDTIIDDGIDTVTYKYGEEIKSRTVSNDIKTISDISGDGEETNYSTEIIVTHLISDDQVVTNKNNDLIESKTIYSNNQSILNTEFTYEDELIKKVKYQDGKTIQYSYDENFKLIGVYNDNKLVSSYNYDQLGQLIRENHAVLGKSIVYKYDNNSNIISADYYEYSTGELLNKLYSKVFSYKNIEWTDELTNINGEEIQYDQSGNPLTYRNNMTLEWKAKTVVSMKSSEFTINYTYNNNNIRTSKTVNGITTKYYLDGNKIILEITEGQKKWYIYDEENKIIGFIFNDNTYYFEKNIQNDVTRIFNNNGEYVSEYIYDAWGNIIGILGDDTIARANPFRYRSYYQDNETELYYLQARYYDSFVGRFISADIFLGANEGVDIYNLFVYCGNDPVSRYDETGMSWSSFWKAVKNVVKKVVSTVLHVVNTIAVKIGIDTAAIGALFLDMKKVNGVYHANFDCWQSLFGYTKFYDIIFDIGTSMLPNTDGRFSYNNQNYILWAWKGDYINLGAGAELGIYKGGTSLESYWAVDKNLAMPMTLKVWKNSKQIIDWTDTHWWITGFNPSYLNNDAKNLTVQFTVQFDIKKNRNDKNIDVNFSNGMYSAFCESISLLKTKSWQCNGNRKATLSF
ncbi:hypothetical protein BCR36DRAFT_585408 [Piromyces finnis]|uniref:Uncharacterized protein n=1 Tax=Piromyces finnis TaxID=1754191 RepID=A0A1Y1V3M0_9FUNG|nr:hypothetical protein BCR36DRAFT_585408 [Piromyces finnis]|eukprot:ORX45938.1 hypothetical protein BCR36DRAFT_585408 [Piromyces finnis]